MKKDVVKEFDNLVDKPSSKGFFKYLSIWITRPPKFMKIVWFVFLPIVILILILAALGKDLDEMLPIIMFIVVVVFIIFIWINFSSKTKLVKNAIKK